MKYKLLTPCVIIAVSSLQSCATFDPSSVVLAVPYAGGELNISGGKAAVSFGGMRAGYRFRPASGGKSPVAPAEQTITPPAEATEAKPWWKF